MLRWNRYTGALSSGNATNVVLREFGAYLTAIGAVTLVFTNVVVRCFSSPRLLLPILFCPSYLLDVPSSYTDSLYPMSPVVKVQLLTIALTIPHCDGVAECFET